MSEYLSQKYPDSSLDDSKHYETVIIAKINRMFHSLELLVNSSSDEISARCLLRAILDSVATYSFIYCRPDQEEKMFRHYLYTLDGYKVYKDNYVCGIMEKEGRQPFESACNDIIEKIEEKLYHHIYSKNSNEIISSIIKEANWKYVSLTNNNRLGFIDLYKMMGIEDQTAKYFQQYLSQFSHGLCLSNTGPSNNELLKRVLSESILVAGAMVKSIYCSFPHKEILSDFSKSAVAQSLLKSSDFKVDELEDYLKSLDINNNRMLI